ncbi:hypothetical protein M408DRAFT_21388 [Serendipita vermifera MAFF 305830]|uniref:Uncharacterized protein n=1 Tax=Serendipita vermifera MAFF 305830 TaxID=933852 RepID=A0A0C3B3C6_SERVB|nr:hypothetical protein M408DRAFT_21388 [Serendipita vermifera MAFF 305830]
MANLQRHPSLRFSVFELAADIGLEAGAFDGKFDAIVEEEEPQTRTSHKQRQTHSSDELTDSSFPLTPPSANAALYSPRPLNLANKKLEDHPRFIERFPTRSPDLVSTTPKPTTPRSGLAKLRKTPTASTTNTPALELLLDFGDSERDQSPRKDGNKKKSSKQEKEQREKFAKGILAQQREKHRHTPPPQSPAGGEAEEEKKLLGGLLRFRTRSKERKTAAKEALQKLSPDGVQNPAPSQTAPPPPPQRQETLPPLPIATRFARPKEEVSFRPQPSESSHGGYSSDIHDAYPRPRDRSSRFERPHPVWRSGTSSLGHMTNISTKEEREKTLPAERHALPPTQSIFDREPARRPSRIDTSNSNGAPTVVDMDVVNKYYGITPERTHTPTPPAAVAPAVPKSHLALAQALEPVETRPLQQLKNTGLAVTPSAPASPSPFIVPSPDPVQTEFSVQTRTKRGRMNIPPALEPGFVMPKRMTGAFNPPPTPPPTMELPPIPTNVPEQSSPLPPRLSPYSQAPPSSMKPPPASPLRMNMSHPNLRIEPSTPSPLSLSHQERPPRSPSQDYGMPRPTSPMRSLSPVQRGKTPAFPARPVTPTRPITPTRQGLAGSPLPASPRPAAKAGSGDSGYRRPQYDPSAPIPMYRPRKSSASNEDLYQLRPSRSQTNLRPSTADAYVGSPSQADNQPLANSNNSADGFGSGGAPVRKRSVRRNNYNQSGYDSDDTSSRYSRDTYYGRETAYFDDQNMPPLPNQGDMPPLPNRDFQDMELERRAGREKLIRMLANSGNRF